MTKNKILNATALQNQLWETLRAVKTKKLRAPEANAIASQAREICRITKLQIEMAKLTGQKTSINNALMIK